MRGKKTKLKGEVWTAQVSCHKWRAVLEGRERVEEVRVEGA